MVPTLSPKLRKSPRRDIPKAIIPCWMAFRAAGKVRPPLVPRQICSEPAGISPCAAVAQCPPRYSISYDGCRESSGAEEDLWASNITGGHTLPIFQTARHGLNPVPSFVAPLVVVDRFVSRLAPWDAGHHKVMSREEIEIILLSGASGQPHHDPRKYPHVAPFDRHAQALHAAERGASSRCRMSCAGRIPWVHHTSVAEASPVLALKRHLAFHLTNWPKPALIPLRLMKIMPLRTRQSSLSGHCCAIP